MPSSNIKDSLQVSFAYCHTAAAVGMKSESKGAIPNARRNANHMALVMKEMDDRTKAM